jgi:hypothetical protein
MMNGLAFGDWGKGGSQGGGNECAMPMPSLQMVPAPEFMKQVQWRQCIHSFVCVFFVLKNLGDLPDNSLDWTHIISYWLFISSLISFFSSHTSHSHHPIVYSDYSQFSSI